MSTTNACIQKQIPDADYVSAEECEVYAGSTSFLQEVRTIQKDVAEVAGIVLS